MLLAPEMEETRRLLEDKNNDQKAVVGEDEAAVRDRRRPIFRRKWTSLDKRSAGALLVMHLLCLLAPFQFTWPAFWLAFVLYIITGLFGLTLSYHRHLTHKSFKLPKWLEYTFAYIGVHTFQGDPIDWVSTHRYHHQFVDTERDPHTPTQGFWFGHIAWIWDSYGLTKKYGRPNNAEDLQKQAFYRFLRRTYILHHVGLAVVLYAVGGLPFLVWGMGVRTVCFQHVTFSVNSLGHMWGNQQWNTGDQSRNNWVLAMLIFGEGWHNNHHAFEYSARHGLEWWQLDVTWWVILLLQALGLATDVKLPSQNHMQKLAIQPKYE
ncbi:palmitoyl-monogalactosyldiacylglycerol delta-7 desaturase, chloroplastic-like isoform X2 [Momordica charantia]|uniref:Palmitoyl-monogalactosyldiacylglycerol delta-7 desaturase, chloroplastic-like isoform X2 n=1 Tax=Momordica charantia TaxID=3673 RepID=A0A6J1DJ11_MOMCH|nr:palmitoyl-monogalactosyldiacylglycerol delta-7 desaturase, chloroplastic-like isoform X2 [Momordica charantia]